MSNYYDDDVQDERDPAQAIQAAVEAARQAQANLESLLAQQAAPAKGPLTPEDEEGIARVQGLTGSGSGGYVGSGDHEARAAAALAAAGGRDASFNDVVDALKAQGVVVGGEVDFSPRRG